jgi:dephospho-CoA kinase
MKVIGLTGRSGSGKSDFCEILRKYGIDCLDTDKVAREVVEKGKPCLNELVSFFGNGILLPDGNLDRKKLGSIAFSDKNKLFSLNSITHKYITEKVTIWLDGQKKDGASAAVIDAPMLFESGEDKMCDMTVAIVCDDKLRIKRITARDGIDEEYAKKRLDSQKPDTFFIEKCSHIIYNNKTHEELEGATLTFLKDECLICEE